MVVKSKKQISPKLDKTQKTLGLKTKQKKRGLLNNILKIFRGIAKVFKNIGRYFKGSWSELRQVRWTNRKATWGLTGAVIIFSAIFVILIVLLDAGFDMLFKLIIK